MCFYSFRHFIDGAYFSSSIGVIVSKMDLPEDILVQAEKSELSLIPRKSNDSYQKEYERFINWMESKNIKDISEIFLLA